MGTTSLSDVIARQEWLKSLEEPLQTAVRNAFAAGGDRARKTENFLHGTWLGQPLHAVLTDVPVGAWTATVMFDVLDAVSGRREFQTAADSALTLGIAGALAAAVTGLADWKDVDPPARRIGLAHGLLNVGGVALFAASLAARRRKSRAAGRGLAALGYAVASVAAHIGGSLVYDQRIGVDHTAGQTLPEDFSPVLPESDLAEGQPKRAEYNGVPILLLKRGSRIFAIAETCSHLGGPLSEGKIEGDSVTCPWHGSRFAMEDGRVLDGPATHPQPCLETRIRNSQIEVRKATGQPMVQTAT